MAIAVVRDGTSSQERRFSGRPEAPSGELRGCVQTAREREVRLGEGAAPDLLAPNSWRPSGSPTAAH